MKVLIQTLHWNSLICVEILTENIWLTLAMLAENRKNDIVKL